MRIIIVVIRQHRYYIENHGIPKPFSVLEEDQQKEGLFYP